MYRLFKLPEFDDREKTFRAQILFTVLWTIILASTAIQVVNLFLAPENYLRWLFVFVFISTICFSLLFLNSVGETKQAGIILLVSLWFLNSFFAYIDGGLDSHILPVFIILVALSGFILGRTAVMVGCAAFIVTGSSLMFLDDYGYLPQVRFFVTSNISVLVSYLFLTLALVFLQDRYIKTLRNAFLLAESEMKERFNIENALEISKEYSNNILETANVMVMGFNEKGNITVFNQTAQKISGYDLSEVRSAFVLYKLIPHDRFPDSYDKFRRFSTIGYPKSFESAILTKSGSVRYLTWECSEVSNGNQNVRWIAFGIDITERKQHEREMEMITTVSAALRVVQTQSELLKVVMLKLHDLFNAGLVSIAMFSLDQQIIFEVLNHDSRKELFDEIFSDFSDLSYVIKSDDVFLNNDVQSHIQLHRYDELQNMQALICVPLITHGKHTGAVVIIREDKIMEDEVHALTAVADITANAIHRISSHELTKNFAQRLAALHKLELAISNHFDLPDLFETVLDQIVHQFQVDAADILLLSPDGMDFIYSAGKGFQSHDRIKNSRRRVGESLVGTAVMTKSIIYIADYSQSDENAEIKEIMLEENITSYYAVPLITKDVVKGVLEIFLRSHMPPQSEWLEFLQMLGSITAISIDDAELFQRLQQANVDLTNAYEATIEGWSHALDLRDKETEGHTRRVTELTERLARRMGLEGEALAHLRRGALLHDIGKMGVPDSILLKPGSLTDEEWDIMKLHPHYAYNMLSSVHYLAKAVDIPYCHHEKWDGTGYPRGLKGEQIPLAARIFSVVDVWDAVTSDRPYRDAWPEKEALQHIRASSGMQFDPQVVQVFVEMMEKSIS